MEEILELPTSQYWNDRELERSKPFDVVNGFDAMIESVNATGSLAHFYRLLAIAERRRGYLGGVGASFGCGVCWLEADVLGKRAGVDLMYLVEMSRHRIFELAPLVLDKYGVSEERVRLCLGSFYDIQLEDDSLDFVILYAAFHHADDPDRLLDEMKRLLRPTGFILIPGEHYFSAPVIVKRAVRHFAKYLLNWKGHRVNTPLLPSWSTLVPASDLKGDRHLPGSEYRRLFSEHGFDHVRLIDRTLSLQGYVLWLR